MLRFCNIRPSRQKSINFSLPPYNPRRDIEKHILTELGANPGWLLREKSLSIVPGPFGQPNSIYAFLIFLDEPDSRSLLSCLIPTNNRFLAPFKIPVYIGAHEGLVHKFELPAKIPPFHGSNGFCDVVFDPDPPDHPVHPFVGDEHAANAINSLINKHPGNARSSPVPHVKVCR